MKVFITGATGLIGKQIIQELLKRLCSITILTRDSDKARQLFGDYVNYCPSLSQLENLNDFDAIINLAGEPIVNKRWTTQQKERLCQSRWHITQQLVDLIHRSEQPPKTFISGSAVGYYGAQQDTILTEQADYTADFTHYLCQRWEEIALSAQSEQTRVCVSRTGIVLSAHGGALAKMLPAFRFGLGGVIGSGQQYMPWIHIQDMVNAIYFLLTHHQLSGPFNLCSPNAVTNQQFSHCLAAELKRPCLIPIPACGLKLAMGESSTLLLDGQRATPEKLLQAGFKFSYPTLEAALHQLLTNKLSHN